MLMSGAKNHLTIRVASVSDLRACHDLDVLAWGAEGAASEDNLRARVEAYPDGNLVAVLASTEKIVGSIWTVCCDDQPIVDWWQASGHGRYAGVSKASGDTVFGVSVAVHPRHPRIGIQAALIRRVGELAWAEGKRQLMFGVPMSDFHLWKDTFSATDYACLRRSRDEVYFADAASGKLHVQSESLLLEVSLSRVRIDPRAWPNLILKPPRSASFDPNLESFTSVRIGRNAPYVREVLPAYFPSAGSCDFGVLVVWTNPRAACTPQRQLCGA